MKSFIKHKALSIFLSALVLFSACKKDSDPAEGPITEPLTTAAVKPGDILVIKGQKFSTVAAENIVQFNGVR